MCQVPGFRWALPAWEGSLGLQPGTSYQKLAFPSCSACLIPVNKRSFRETTSQQISQADTPPSSLKKKVSPEKGRVQLSSESPCALFQGQSQARGGSGPQLDPESGAGGEWTNGKVGSREQGRKKGLGEAPPRRRAVWVRERPGLALVTGVKAAL